MITLEQVKEFTEGIMTEAHVDIHKEREKIRTEDSDRST